MKMNITSSIRKKTFLKYHQYGNTNNPAIILLHGLFGELSNWENTIEYFKSEYRVIVPVLPIYESEYQRDGLNGFVSFVNDLMNELKIEKAILVGNSLGGHISVLYTIAHPEKVVSLILTGSSGLYENTMGSSYPKRGNYDYIEEKVRYTFHNDNIVTKSLVDKVYETVNNIRKSISVIKVVRAANKNNVSEALKKINVPSLLIWGRQDRITPLSVAYRFNDLLPNTKLEVIENCGHAPMMEQPDIFNKVLSGYLRFYENKYSDFKNVG